MTTKTLTYKRKATKAKDGANGFLYLDVWATGAQLLVFRDRAHVDSWAAGNGVTVKLYHPERAPDVTVTRAGRVG